MSAVLDILQGVLKGVAGPVIDKFFPDKQKAQEFAQELELEMLKNSTAIALAQAEINKIDAASEDWVSRRWRPITGWTCSVIFALNYAVFPLLKVVYAMFGEVLHVDPLDMSEIMPVLLGMLGLGGMRSYDKKQSK